MSRSMCEYARKQVSENKHERGENRGKEFVRQHREGERGEFTDYDSAGVRNHMLQAGAGVCVHMDIAMQCTKP
jgi:hypothetical protein